MAFRSTVPQERPEYDLSNDLHEEVAADVVTESGAAGTTVLVVASLSIAADTEPFRGANSRNDRGGRGVIYFHEAEPSAKCP